MAATIPTKGNANAAALFLKPLAFLILACLTAPLFAQATNTFIAGSGNWSPPQPGRSATTLTATRTVRSRQVLRPLAIPGTSA
jgi:hypothetical protein